MDYGLRWDYYGVIGAHNKAFSSLDVKTAGLVTVGAAGSSDALYPKDWTDFAPRLSLADDLMGNGKLVNRVGRGIYSGSTYSCGNSQTVSYGQRCFPTYSVGSYVGIPLHYVNQIETSASSNYNSAQATLKLQGWRGLTSTLNYTWAHSIDDASDGLAFVPNASQPDNSFNSSADRASSDFDVRQRMQWYWTYNLPTFHQAKWIGWALDGMFNFATGQPYTVSYLFEGNNNGTGEWYGRPDIIADPHTGPHGTGLLNLAAFAAPCTVDSESRDCIDGHPGSEGRNAFNSPSYTNFDFSFTKTSHLTEHVTTQIRCDFFNIINHPNFSNPLLPGFGIDVSGIVIRTEVTWWQEPTQAPTERNSLKPRRRRMLAAAIHTWAAAVRGVRSWQFTSVFSRSFHFPANLGRGAGRFRRRRPALSPLSGWKSEADAAF